MFNIRLLRDFEVGIVFVYEKLRYIKARAGDISEASRLQLCHSALVDQKTNVITIGEAFLGGYAVPKVRRNFQGVMFYRE